MTATADKTVLEGLDKQNGVTLGRVLGRGSVGQAEEGSDGKMHATVRIPLDELVFEPRVLVLPHGGDLELEIVNDDNNSHCAILPSNGDLKFIWLSDPKGELWKTFDSKAMPTNILIEKGEPVTRKAPHRAEKRFARLRFPF